MPIKRRPAAQLAEEVRRVVESYYSVWNRPIKYRDVIPRFSARLPKEMSLLDFVEYLEKNKICVFMVSPRARQYVFPYREATPENDDEMMQQLLDMDRAKITVAQTADRVRKRKLKLRFTRESK